MNPAQILPQNVVGTNWVPNSHFCDFLRATTQADEEALIKMFHQIASCLAPIHTGKYLMATISQNPADKGGLEVINQLILSHTNGDNYDGNAGKEKFGAAVREMVGTEPTIDIEVFNYFASL